MNPTTNTTTTTPYPLFVAIDRQGPILTREQERCLARRVRRGDPRARAHLIEANLRLAIKLAAQRAPTAPTMELHDLIQEATTGLILAIDRFDPERGFKLSTYATWWINQALTRAVAKDGTVHMPIELRRQLRRAEGTLAQRLGRVPTHQEIADQIDLDPEDIRRARAAMHPVSLDAPLADEQESGCFGDIVPDRGMTDPAEIVTEHADLRADIEAITSTLSSRERTVIEHRYGLDGREPRTTAQIASDIDTDAGSVRRIERRAFETMRRGAQLHDRAIGNPGITESAHAVAVGGVVLLHNRPEPAAPRA